MLWVANQSQLNGLINLLGRLGEADGCQKKGWTERAMLGCSSNDGVVSQLSFSCILFAWMKQCQRSPSDGVSNKHKTVLFCFFMRDGGRLI